MTKNKLGTVLLAFSIAFGLWLYVITYVSTDHTQTLYNVPVALEGKGRLADRGLMILDEENYLVDITVSGSRQDVSKINSGNVQVVADLNGIWDPGDHSLTYTIIYPGDVPSGSVKDQKNPDRITVSVAKKKTKEVPVEVSFEGDVPADYIKDTAAMELDKEYIQISGPEEVVDQIARASIRVDCEGRTQAIYESFRFELQNEYNIPVDAQWITTDVSEVRVYVPVVMVKKVPLKLTIVDGGGATEETSKIVIDPKELTVSGNESALRALEEINLGTVNLAQITEDTELEFNITLPDGITNISNLPTARVKITFPKLATREFTITEFEQKNLAKGMVWEPLTKQLTITVRGLKSEVQKLTLQDIQVCVDLADVENTSAVEPAITFAKNYDSLGVVGSYSISVQVTPEDAATEE